MSIFVYSNNASSTLASGILSTDTTCTIQAGQGALFPAIAAGQVAAIALEDVSGNIEIVYATAKSTDTFTISRGQEGTTARAFASGSRCEVRVTAGVLGQCLQKTGGDTLSGTTTVSGVVNLGSGGSIQGGEFTGALRGAPGQTSNQVLVPSSGPATSGGSPILTTANLAANLPAGYGILKTQMIVMWNGTTGTIPSGFHLCDGTFGTPDLRDKFVVGGGGAAAPTGGSNTTSTAGSHNHGGSTSGYALTVADLPAHSHDFWATNTCGYAGGANPPFTIPMWETGGSGGTAQYLTNVPGNATGGANTQIIKNTGGGGAHSHPMSTDGSHAHTVTPPYVAVLFIMKL